MFGYEFYVDPSRCIGCQSCVKACEECDTHRGQSMINFDFSIARKPLRRLPMFAGTAKNRRARRFVPRTPSRKARTVWLCRRLSRGASLAKTACWRVPFGIPKIIPEYEQMMKCDMCYDRTSVGRNRCARRFVRARRWLMCGPKKSPNAAETPSNVFYFGAQKITTQVYMMMPSGTDSVTLDITEFMWDEANV